MATPRVLILRAPGTNCDEETAHAFRVAGATADPVHINRLREGSIRLDDYQILCLPGGFSFGDDIAAGKILANQLRHHLADALREFQEAGKLILGICNGFQVLIKSGLLVADDDQGPRVTLTANDSGKYEDRWVRLGVEGSRSVFLRGIETLELPVAHGEGKFVARNEGVLDELECEGRLVLRYLAQPEPATVGAEAGAIGESAPFRATADDRAFAEEVPYPDNPNGAARAVAGICDASGRVLGLMPHPERYIDPTQHPRWTRLARRDAGDGLRIFQNAVQYFR